MQKIKSSAENLLPETPLDLQRTFMELVKKEFDSLRCFADSKVRSDSFPTENSGDEARACDREIEVSPADFFRYLEC